ncbi:MAG: NUDIX domain-containing protein [Nitrospiraceae bacterium]|nr:MAG: NUDIX domain-containing protein [Nitrospiraceae bacterium]
MEELLEVINEHGDVINILPRSVIHGNPSFMHRVAHVLVFDQTGDLLLQKRSLNKDVAPGKWDTSVGGHVNPGETLLDAARRETAEELGLSQCEPEFIYSYVHSNPYETELVFTHSCVCFGEISFNREEIDEVRYWSTRDILQSLGTGVFSDNFEHEIKMYLKYKGSVK